MCFSAGLVMKRAWFLPILPTFQPDALAFLKAILLPKETSIWRKRKSWYSRTMHFSGNNAVIITTLPHHTFMLWKEISLFHRVVCDWRRPLRSKRLTEICLCYANAQESICSVQRRSMSLYHITIVSAIKQLLVSAKGGRFTLGSGDALLEFPPGAVKRRHQFTMQFSCTVHLCSVLGTSWVQWSSTSTWTEPP